MKKILIILGLSLSTSVFSSVVTSFDAAKDCKLFRVTTEESPLIQDEVIIFDRDVYGLTIQNMKVDFKQKLVSVDPMMNVVLGFNRLLQKDRIIIKEKNPEFNFLINQLNRKIYVFEKMCINDNNELIYAKIFENQSEKK